MYLYNNNYLLLVNKLLKNKYYAMSYLALARIVVLGYVSVKLSGMPCFVLMGLTVFILLLKISPSLY